MRKGASRCFICDRIRQIRGEANQYFVAEMETGYVVVGDYQFYRGYTFFLCKKHVFELRDLSPRYRQKFLEEMSIVAAAVFRAFKPRKLNYELLGNTVAHMHWHLIPRYSDDPDPKRPIWVIEKKVRESESTRPTMHELQQMKAQLRTALRASKKKTLRLR